MIHVIVANASVISKMVSANLFLVLAKVTTLECIVPEVVMDKIADPDELAVVDSAITAGRFRVVRLEDEEGQADYRALCELMDKGEATGLALAKLHPDWHVVSDECRTFRRLALERLSAGRLLTAEDIITQMIPHLPLPTRNQ